MKAAIFNGVGQPITIEYTPDPTPGRGEVVVKVGRCGICGTDVHSTHSHMFAPPAGTALGHEFSGEVVELGAGITRLKIGDRIAVMPMAGCGECAACRDRHPYACTKMRMMMGGFGEYTLASERETTLLPAALTLADGALVEPVAAARRGVTMANMPTSARVLVIGAGTMGLASIFWARRAGAGKIVATARSSWRESMTLQMGADAFIVSDDNLSANVNAALNGPPDVVIECAGVPGMMAQAINLVRPRGTVLAAGGCMDPDQFIPFIAMYKEVRLQFSGAYTLNDFQAVVDVLEGGATELRNLITETVPLAAMPQALESLRSTNRQCKVMIDPWMH